MTQLTEMEIWQELAEQAKQLPHMRQLFAEDQQRFDNMSISACDLLLDYSKTGLITTH